MSTNTRGSSPRKAAAMVGSPRSSSSLPRPAILLAVVIAIAATMVYWKALLYAGLASGAALFRKDNATAAGLDQCPGYRATNVRVTATGVTADLTLAGAACNVYGTDLPHLTLQVTYQTEDRLHVLIQDQGNQVYQVPESVFPRPGGSIWSQTSKLKFSYTAYPFSFKITRAKTGEVIFDTSAASLVFESQYLRLRTSLPANPNLYGLGEHSDSLRLETTNYIRTMWNQDSYGIPSHANLYGTHPFYLEQRASGAHGVFFLNSNGMDIIINQDASGKQYLEYNTIGGVFDFYFVAGPTPVAAVQQYGEFAGFPTMQPYWGLGFHQCRYGYRDAFDVAEVVQNYSLAGIPLETMWTDIDYMDRRRLCARWASLGAFNTFYRNHNDYGNIGQEFYRWPSVASAAKKAIDIRYRLLDYIYTALWRQSTDGTPAVSPMFFHYPDDPATWGLELQFFFGPGLVVAPVTQQGSTSVSVYLPTGVFYDWYTHARVDGGATTHAITGVDITSIPLFIRGGVILPLRAKSASTTTELRKQNFELLIALDASGSASGELYLDDGVSIHQRATTHVTFTYNKGLFILGGSFSLRVPFIISKVTILGGKPSAAAKSSAGGNTSNSETFDVHLPFTGPASVRIG
ncbi:glycoside hydrolase family 31 protein [Trichoderma longibrachiatum ATCC 18648]|uniref:Glycoside hydrolase family 31 protein n=1 Tax=Trichoderma longibrachiatum ATCC 18648 TaxID=983965 RepID=A0A2T4BPQ5_TRILO|nr:glycoside hydrolase family 31 protein [Trichoderma longibrachiatum ATCC 18648]